MVTILLATLNGEDYLKAQLESIAAQTYENWQLVVGDDGSTDDTISIIEEFSEKHPDQVTSFPCCVIPMDHILCFVIRMTYGNRIRFI